jgi:2,3-bisphosphoglycerate-dependent phosphoglycerate mutase
VIEKGSEFSQDADARYAGLGADLPMTECLKDVVNRMAPYLDGELAADLNAGKTVLVTAHGNSIRAMVKHIDCISDTDIAGVNIPTGIPLLYEFDDQFEPIKKGGEYLDPDAAKAAIEAVANQGKK